MSWFSVCATGYNSSGITIRCDGLISKAKWSEFENKYIWKTISDSCPYQKEISLSHGPCYQSLMGADMIKCESVVVTGKTGDHKLRVISTSDTPPYGVSNSGDLEIYKFHAGELKVLLVDVDNGSINIQEVPKN